jgi:hypothetical protein
MCKETFSSLLRLAGGIEAQQTASPLTCMINRTGDPGKAFDLDQTAALPFLFLKIAHPFEREWSVAAI